MAQKTIMVLIICYKAENTIREVLDGITKEMWERVSEILVLDDASPAPDQTFKVANECKRRIC